MTEARKKAEAYALIYHMETNNDTAISFFMDKKINHENVICIMDEAMKIMVDEAHKQKDNFRPCDNCGQAYMPESEEDRFCCDVCKHNYYEAEGQ